MWDYVQLPQAADDPSQREKLIEQYAADKMREYDGTIFLCISRSDRERWAAPPRTGGLSVRRIRLRSWQSVPDGMCFLWTSLCSNIWGNT